MGATTERKGKNITKEGGRYAAIAKYFLLTMLLSFLGWGYEMLLMLLMTGRFQDRGFMTMPFCPIYGCSLIVVYFLLGTPDEKRGILKNAENPLSRYGLYLLFAFLVPTVAELLVGAFFDVFFDVWLWSYDGIPLNFRGYISLPVSVLWAVMIFLFMKYLFPPLKRLIFRIPEKPAILLAVLLAIAVAVDLTLAYITI